MKRSRRKKSTRLSLGPSKKNEEILCVDKSFGFPKSNAQALGGQNRRGRKDLTKVSGQQDSGPDPAGIGHGIWVAEVSPLPEQMHRRGKNRDLENLNIDSQTKRLP